MTGPGARYISSNIEADKRSASLWPGSLLRIYLFFALFESFKEKNFILHLPIRDKGRGQYFKSCSLYVNSGTIQTSLDHIYIKQPDEIGLNSDSSDLTVDHLVVYENSPTGNTDAGVEISTSASTFTDLRMVGTSRAGIYIGSSANGNTIENLRCTGCNTDSSSLAGCIRGGGNNNIIRGGYSDAFEDDFVYLGGDLTNLKFVGHTVGTNVTASAIVGATTGIIVGVLFDGCDLTYTNFLNTSDTYDQLLTGSYITMHYCDASDFTNDEESVTYTPNGTYSKTGLTSSVFFLIQFWI